MRTITQLRSGVNSAADKFVFCVNAWNELCAACAIEYEILELKNGVFKDGENWTPKNIGEIVKECKYWYGCTQEPGHDRNPSEWRGADKYEYNECIKQQRYLKNFITVFSPYEGEEPKKVNSGKKVKVVVKKKNTVAQVPEKKELPKENIKEVEPKNIIIKIKYNFNENSWILTFADNRVANIKGSLLKYINLPDIQIADYYEDFIKKYTELIKKRDSIPYSKRWKDLSDAEQAKAYDFLEKKQSEGEFNKFWMLEGEDSVFYDGEGNLLGFNSKDAKSVTKEEIINSYRGDIDKLVTDENNIIDYIMSTKPEEERDVKYYLVQRKRKFFLVEKKNVKKFTKEGAKIIEKLSEDWEAELLAREKKIEIASDKERIGKSEEYEMVKFGLFNEDGEVITSSIETVKSFKAHKIGEKGSTSEKQVEVKYRKPITISTGKISHHKISERKNNNDQAINPEKLMKELSELYTKLDEKEKEVGKAYAKTYENVTKKMEEMRQNLNDKLQASISLNTIRVEQKAAFTKNIPKLKIKGLNERISTAEEVPEDVLESMAPDIGTPSQGFYSVITDEEDMFTVCDKNELKNIIEQAIEIKRVAHIEFEKAFIAAVSNADEEVQNSFPTFFYQVPQPKPYIPRYYQTEVLYGCYYAAIKFFLYVSNTPIDEEYDYERVVPEHEVLKHKKPKIVKGYEKSGIPILRSEQEVMDEATETKIVPEHTVKVHHKPDEHFVRGDWVMTFRGKNFKAFPTEPDRGESSIFYDYTMNASWFELENRTILTIDDANERSDKIEQIATFLYEHTQDYEPPINEEGVPIFGRDTFNCPCTNINPRFIQLEKGRYKKVTGFRAEGPKYPHGLINHYSYQAPKGFIEVTNQYLNQFTLNAKGYAKQASVLINRFSSHFNTKWGERYFEDYIKDISFDVQNPGKQYKANKRFNKNTTKEIQYL